MRAVRFAVFGNERYLRRYAARLRDLAAEELRAGYRWSPIDPIDGTSPKVGNSTTVT